MKRQVLNFFSILSLGLLAFSANSQIVVLAEAPEDAVGSFNFTDSFTNQWGGSLESIVIQAPVALYSDGTAADSLACGAALNAADLAGKIAFLYRGTCEFGAKALNAQNAGAVAVVIVNNVAGDPVGMGAGANGASVTIPVVMISNTDGAFLRPFVDSGELEMFIGNKTGYFANDTGFLNRDVAMAKSQVIPLSFAVSSADFNVPLLAWVKNYGNDDQDQVVLNATVSLGGNILYNESSTPANIPADDSLLVVLPVFSLFSYTEGEYTITYTTSSENDDEFAADNSRSFVFWINDEGYYAKSRMNAQTGYPVAGGGIRPSDSANYSWCTFLRSSNAEAEQIHAVSFSTITNNDLDLTGQFVYAEVFKWNDPFDENSTEVTFTDLELVGDAEYNYEFNYQNEFVSAIFAQPIPLINNQKYLVCASIFVNDMFFRVDGGIDYNRTYDAYPAELFFPIISGGEWFAGGFGTDAIPAIITHFSEPNFPIISVDETAANELPVRAYPNPANNFINLPVPAGVTGNLALNVFDINGREVMTERLNNAQGGNSRVDIAGLDNGVYVFRLTEGKKLVSSFRVVVNK